MRGEGSCMMDSKVAGFGRCCPTEETDANTIRNEWSIIMTAVSGFILLVGSDSKFNVKCSTATRQGLREIRPRLEPLESLRVDQDLGTNITALSPRMSRLLQRVKRKKLSWR